MEDEVVQETEKTLDDVYTLLEEIVELIQK